MKNGRILSCQRRRGRALDLRSLPHDPALRRRLAAELGVHEHTVGKWRRRFLKRIEGLSDEPRPGRPRTLTDEQVAEVIERTLETTPADATH